MFDIAILGYGTVGSGVVEVLNTNRKLIEKRSGQEIRIKYVLDLREFPGDPIQELIVHDFNIILEDPDIKLVVEVMGGLKPAYEFTKAALSKGKSVCTSNKELVARYGTELIKTAKENNANYLFEASCGGGIPIIRPLNTSLTAEDIIEVSGILNGTTNYILTEMAEKGTAFPDVLKEAQELGYAERNPEADIEGHDACRKLAILSSLAFGKTVHYEDIHTEGIRSVSPQDIAFAHKLNMAVKLLANCYKQTIEGVTHYFAMVAPYLVQHEHPLFSVNGVYNAIFIRGNTLGSTMFYGRGAGSLPTASAVVGDIVDAIKHYGINIRCIWDEERLPLSSFDTAVRPFFLRVPISRVEEAKDLFKAEKVLILPSVPDEAGIVTAPVAEQELAEKSAAFGEVLGRIRINR